MTTEDPPLQSRTELLAALADAGTRLGEAATAAGLDAGVPSCPEWDVRELVRHTGGVHRWATRHVAEAIGSPIPGSDDLESFVGGWPADGDLMEWFGDGVSRLVGVLDAASDDLECFTFLSAPTPRWFWTRRQAHETSMHAFDAELAAGGTTSLDPAFCADGLDELLTGFVPRMRRRYTSATGERLSVVSADTGHRFALAVGEAGAVAERGADVGTVHGESAQVTVSGPAEALYLWGWSREGRDRLEITGDAGVLDHFEQAVHVNW